MRWLIRAPAAADRAPPAAADRAPAAADRAPAVRSQPLTRTGALWEATVLRPEMTNKVMFSSPNSDNILQDDLCSGELLQ